eukprot:5712724-Pyramimonas_sp.AAC.1
MGQGEKGCTGRARPGGCTFGSTGGQPQTAASTLQWGVRLQLSGADFLAARPSCPRGKLIIIWRQRRVKTETRL